MNAAAGTICAGMATTRHMTAEEFAQLPDDGRVLELVRGIVVEVEPPPGVQHEYVVMRVGRLLVDHVERHGLGAVVGAPGFVLARGPDDVRAPDVAFIGPERADEVARTPGYWAGAPDLAIEILSPSNSLAELERKAGEWLAAGARAVLLLVPRQRTATVFRQAGDRRDHGAEDSIDLEDVVPGWRPRLADLLS
jgi:Uma2 family endonuclease